jgi:hypothetical protein
VAVPAVPAAAIHEGGDDEQDYARDAHISDAEIAGWADEIRRERRETNTATSRSNSSCSCGMKSGCRRHLSHPQPRSMSAGFKLTHYREVRSFVVVFGARVAAA